MAKQMYTVRDWSGGMNNRRDPRDLAPNQYSVIENMSVDSIGKIKTVGGLFAHSVKSTGSGTLSEYIVESTTNINGGGGYGLFYFESDHSRDSDQTIIETKSGTALALGTSNGQISFVAVKSSPDTITAPEYSGE
tara:strand:- start:97 stop:501 length:405 start_codon:yes stop_codon:yes gene_type:complete